MYRLSLGEKWFAVFNNIFLIFLAFTTVYPFIYTVSISLSSTAEAMRSGFHLYPKEVSFTSFNMVMKNPDILNAYFNTVVRTVAGTAAAVLVTSMYAYALSRSYMPFKRFFTFILIFTMLFSGGLIPSYLLIKSIGLMNNRLVYILPYLIGAFNVIIIKNYFQSVPNSLHESAKIDGANEFVIFFQIIFPLSKPVLATVALWVSVMHWNMWFDGLMYITVANKQILQIFLQRIVQENNSQFISQGLVNPDITSFTPETIKAATIVVTILPVLAIYPFIQRYFVKGIMLGSVKG